MEAWIPFWGVVVLLAMLSGRAAWSGESVLTLKGHTSYRIWTVAFTRDGKTLISSAEDDTIRLWNVRTGVLERILYQKDESEGSALFFDDDGSLRFRNTKTGAIVRIAHVDMLHHPVCLSPDGRSLALGICRSTYEPNKPAAGARCTETVGRIEMWSLNSGEKLAEFGGDNNKLTAGDRLHLGTSRALPGSFSPDGRLLASAVFRGRIVLWDVATGKIAKTFPGLKHEIHNVLFSPSGRTVVGVEFRAKTDTTGRHAGLYRNMRSDLLFWDVESGELVRRIKAHKARTVDVALSPDGRLLASMTQDEIKVWDAETGELQFTTDNFFCKSLTFTPDGMTLAAVGYDVILWDVAAWKQKARMQDKSRTFQSVAFTVDGKRIAIGGSHVIQIWDLEAFLADFATP